MAKTRKHIGFKQAFEYLLDMLCYAYYVKNDNLVSDQTFDDLEKLYKQIFKAKTAPCRGLESPSCYTKGVQILYPIIKEDINDSRNN